MGAYLDRYLSGEWQSAWDELAVWRFEKNGGV